MGLFDFVKDAGEKLFGGGDDEPATTRDLDRVLADKETGAALRRLVQDSGLAAGDLQVKFRDGVATVEGAARSQADRERVVLMLGNTQGVARVDDRIRVDAPVEEKKEPEAVMYTVQSGDSLSKIAKAHYGNASKYMAIFDANKPMLQDPNKIYPGQVLRIPPLES